MESTNNYENLNYNFVNTNFVNTVNTNNKSNNNVNMYINDVNNVNNMGNLKIVSYNCYGFKANSNFVQLLLAQFDICFFCEHWLAEEEEYLFKQMSSTHHFIFKASYSAKDKIRGRPYGGLCWAIDKSINIVDVQCIEDDVSMLRIILNECMICLHGVWLPYDDNSNEKYAKFKSNISLLCNNIKENDRHPNCIIGDFNASLNRHNVSRFDRCLIEFIEKRKLISAYDHFNEHNLEYNNSYTYKKGNYQSRIDHILVNDVALNTIRECSIINDHRDLSDHKPISISLEIERYASLYGNQTKSNSFHKFNWKNREFIECYKANVENSIKLDDFKLDSSQTRELIDNNIHKLNKLLLKCAREAENQINKTKKVIRNKNTQRQLSKMWYETKLQNVFSQFKKIEYNHIRKKMRQFQRKSNFQNQRHKCLEIDKMLHYDKTQFWKVVKAFKRDSKGSEKKPTPKLEEFAQYYSNLFSHMDRPSNNEQMEIENEVNQLYEESKTLHINEEIFSRESIFKAISDLKIGKAIGHDCISNEMIKYGAGENLITIMHCVFNKMVQHGSTPTDFNASLVTPIPKKGQMNKVEDFRPISVSSTWALLYESLILSKIDFSKMISKNQFGYQESTSCKHTYFVVNETINYYVNGGSEIKLVSLDATKAFDKLWRAGLFSRLYKEVDIFIWRAIVSYYEQSKIVVKIDNNKSESYRTTEGVKQGGILSPYLFNFFINGLIEECCKLDVGARIEGRNVSIIGYCDDIMLMSSSSKDMNELLEKCADFARTWKMEFNPKKSNYTCFGAKFSNNDIHMERVTIPLTRNFVYLGLPIGDDEYKSKFIDDKFSKTERAFYSLYSLGCKPCGLSPKTIAYVYKQYCQSIFKFGLELIFISNKNLEMLNVRQNLLVKRTLGLTKYARTSPLFKVLQIESIKALYMKHKIFMYKQVKSNELSNHVFEKTKKLYIEGSIKLNNNNLLKQIYSVNKELSTTDCLTDPVKAIKEIGFGHQCDNSGLLDSIKYILNNYNTDVFYNDKVRILKGLLNYENGVSSINNNNIDNNVSIGLNINNTQDLNINILFL
jgi:hypothetical protein